MEKISKPIYRVPSAAVSGIYAIVNIATLKGYVKAASNLKEMYEKQFDALARGVHPVKNLQEDYNKYGKNGFAFCLIEACDVPSLQVKERSYIIAYDATNPNRGYNVDIPKGEAILKSS